MIFQNKRVLITGGTGSLGKSLVRHIMTGRLGKPKQVIIFSRDEDKQYAMELEWKNLKVATDDVFYHADEILGFQIGDVRDYESVVRAVKQADIIIHAAALKQVPISESFPFESIKTNILGAQNIIRAILENDNHVDTVLAISTDKACKPVNTYGMCKAIQERLLVEANRLCPNTRFICTRYGNVAASRGSIIPLFQEQIKSGGPVTITREDMTRFYMSLDTAIDTITEAIRSAEPGDIYIPDLPSVKVLDLAAVMIGERKVKTKTIGVRPGEKIHEILISEEEIPRTIKRGKYYVILPILPNLRKHEIKKPVLDAELSSSTRCMSKRALKAFLQTGGYLNF
ncbi:MAG: polysaccharide biosynthesis protein [Chloroflexi bacterium RBG_16_51_9]|nr:MAG: polysaccharide biosynthesis protein [Chloroflexi bacterium RBG_16_51_9]